MPDSATACADPELIGSGNPTPAASCGAAGSAGSAGAAGAAGAAGSAGSAGVAGAAGAGAVCGSGDMRPGSCDVGATPSDDCEDVSRKGLPSHPRSKAFCSSFSRT